MTVDWMDFLLAVIPVAWLVIAFMVLKMQGWMACIAAAVISIALAMLNWDLGPGEAVTASLEGIFYALWPICLVIVAALYAYNVTVKTGAMEKIKSMLTQVTEERLILLLIIGFGFGGFMEGMAGFGTAVAVPAGILIGIGMDPIPLIVALTIGDAVATPFGAVGLGVYTMESVSGQAAMDISRYTMIQEILPMLLAPFLMVLVCGGIKGIKRIFPFILISSVSYTGAAFFFGYFVGPELPMIAAPILSIACTVLATRFIPVGKEEPEAREEASGTPGKGKKKEGGLSLKEGIIAWSPFILVFLFLVATSSLVEPVHSLIQSVNSQVQIYSGEDPNTITFYWIGASGVWIFLAAILGGLLQGAHPGTLLGVLVSTLQFAWKTIVTICSVLALAKVMSYSGMIMDIAGVFVVLTGSFFPLISPVIGVVGGFITASATMTSVLLGELQTEAAKQIGQDPAWIASASMYGGCIGKMISIQTLSIGAASANITGKEREILPLGTKYCILLAVLAGLICYFLPGLLGI